LEEHLASRVFVELSRREDRGAMRHALQSFTGFQDVVESQHCYSSSEKRFVVPPLGGIIWRHEMVLRLTIPPKGGTTNCAFHQLQIFLTESVSRFALVRTLTTFCPSSLSRNLTVAAVAAAPAPSTKLCVVRQSSRIARMISLSLTNTISSTPLRPSEPRMMSKVSAAGTRVATPSANVRASSVSTMRPAFQERETLGAPSACTP